MEKVKNFAKAEHKAKQRQEEEVYKQLGLARVWLCTDMRQRYPNFGFPFACRECELLRLYSIDWYKLVTLIDEGIARIKVKLLRNSKRAQDLDQAKKGYIERLTKKEWSMELEVALGEEKVDW